MAEVPVTPVAPTALEPETFPKRGAYLKDIVPLAYTFDGYAHFGREQCAEVCNAALSSYYRTDELPSELETLRACLFFEARRWSLYDAEPDTKARIYIHALLDAIAAKVDELKS